MRDKRQSTRFEKRCETDFLAEGITHRGICLDLSLNGLFIETDFRFSPDTMLNILIHLPDGTISKLKGKVVRCLDNGIGVGIIEKDASYLHYYSRCLLEPEAHAPLREP
ncbi:MAG TPA: PilZ domain-containing protein [Thermodesulfovibrionales bacterium]|nr:PilZ domain-containing protein [Thermodesulfovibrionales bacterium]